MPALGDRVLLLSSTAHSFGLIAGLLHSLAAGVAAVFAPPGVGPRHPADRRGATGVTRPVRDADPLRTARHRQASSRRCPTCASRSPAARSCPRKSAARFADRYGIAVGESYGTTETGVVAMDVGGACGPRSAGRPRVCGCGSTTASWTSPLGRSPYLLDSGGARYADGWLHTRDRASLDADGAVRVQGRGDSLVVIGGLKVDLTEVENVLRDHPGVSEAVVVHAGTTEAYVSDANRTGPRPGSCCAGAGTGWPTTRCRASIQVLPDLPRTSNGKLIRRRDALLARSPGH